MRETLGEAGLSPHFLDEEPGGETHVEAGLSPHFLSEELGGDPQLPPAIRGVLDVDEPLAQTHVSPD